MQVNKLRYVIEQVIANFRTWRIIYTDYRRPIGTFPETISQTFSSRCRARIERGAGLADGVDLITEGSGVAVV